MKLFSLNTTTKLYLLTLLLIFGIIFLNQSAFAQSGMDESSTSQKRLKLMQRYQSWVDYNKYGDYKKDLGISTINEFKSFLSRVILEDEACLNETDPKKLSDCKTKIKFDYKLSKKYNRVLKYLQIEEGKSNICVKADMGVGKALKAKGFNPVKAKPDNPKETGLTEKSTVYLCTGQDGKKKVRVVDSSGTLLKLSEEDAKRHELQPENLPPKDSFNILLKKLGLTTPSGKITATPNPCIIPIGSQTCGKVKIEWDVTDETSDPVEVKTKNGVFIEKSRNGSADIVDIDKNGKTFILYSLGRQISEVVVESIQQ